MLQKVEKEGQSLQELPIARQTSRIGAQGEEKVKKTLRLLVQTSPRGTQENNAMPKAPRYFYTQL